MKLLKYIFLIWIVSNIIISLWFSEDFYYDYNNTSTEQWDTEIWWIIKSDNIEKQDSLINRLLDLFNLSSQDRYNSGTSKWIYYAKMIINMALSFVSLIALIMLIYWFYMMFFSREESGIARAKQILKWVWLALAIMWLARFIVSFIFWIQQSSA